MKKDIKGKSIGKKEVDGGRGVVHLRREEVGENATVLFTCDGCTDL